MAEPKTRPTKESVADFLDRIPDAQRRADCYAVAAMMRAATAAEAVMWGHAIVGFGSRAIRYADGRELAWPVIAFSPRKSDLTLYLASEFPTREALLAKLGKHKQGKSCVYLKKLADIDQKILVRLIKASLKSPH
ncbi:MAG: DUF1801 domain-containing protein [Pseudomonadota bacterium]